MPKQPKPDVGDIVEYHFIAYDQTLRGEVIDLLNKQFTIRIHSPKFFKDKTHFIFYDDDYLIHENDDD